MKKKKFDIKKILIMLKKKNYLLKANPEMFSIYYVCVCCSIILMHFNIYREGQFIIKERKKKNAHIFTLYIFDKRRKKERKL